MRKSIGFKLFAIMFAIILLMGAGQLFVQSAFFADYYELSRKQDLEKQLEAYGQVLDGHGDPEAFVRESLSKGHLVATAAIGPGEVEGLSLSSIQNTLDLETTEGETYRVIADLQQDNPEFILGRQIVVEGFVLNDERPTLNAFQISSDDGRVFYNAAEVYYAQDEGDDIALQPQMVYVEGRIVKVNNHYDTQSMYLKDMALEYLLDRVMMSSPVALAEAPEGDLNENALMALILTEEKQVTVFKNVKNYVVLKEHGASVWLIGATSITPVKEVMAVFNRFVALIFFGIIALSLPVAYLFSLNIKKPILSMTTYAKDLANQEFHTNLHVVREDELGELGKSLELISLNLQDKISTLEQANNQLKDEINHQHIMKEKQKELVANIAHELKTPLTVMNGYIKGVHSGIYPSDDLGVFHKLEQEVTDMNTMVISILSLFKLQTEKQHLTITAFNLWEPVLAIYDKLHFAFSEKGLELDYNYDREYMVSGDREKIEALINNLIVNALRYALPETTIHLEMFEEGQEVVFRLRNRSNPISEEDLTRLCDPFYRLDKARSKSGGTGLGLSIVKEILVKHDSPYSINYDDGWFVFTFRLKKAVAVRAL